MAQQTINVGQLADDGTGDPERTAFQKANENFGELFDHAASKANPHGVTAQQVDAYTRAEVNDIVSQKLIDVAATPSLQPIAPWATNTNYVSTAPASYVREGSSTYACLLSHKSGVFLTDLAAGYWGEITRDGSAGDGTGDVVGPGTSVTGLPAVFADTSGKQLGAADGPSIRAAIGALSAADLDAGTF